MTDALVRSVIVCSVEFVLPVVANGRSGSGGMHCNGLQNWNDVPPLLQPPHVRVQSVQVPERQQCTRQRKQKGGRNYACLDD